MGILFRFISSSVVFVCLLLWQAQLYAYEYCDAAHAFICPNSGSSHFMCNKDQSVPSLGTLKAHVPFTNKLRRTFLEGHNQFRNNVASGHFENFPKASRLRELVWDNQLAYMAHEHAGQCSSLNDLCHNTDEYLSAGQNVNRIVNTTTMKIADVINATFNTWFNDTKNIPNDDDVGVVHNYTLPLNSSRFAVIMHEYTSRLGCAVAYCVNCSDIGATEILQNHCYTVTCNYDISPFNSYALYNTSDKAPAGNCDFWETTNSKEYENLCKSTEKYYQFPFER